MQISPEPVVGALDSGAHSFGLRVGAQEAVRQVTSELKARLGAGAQFTACPGEAQGPREAGGGKQGLPPHHPLISASISVGGCWFLSRGTVGWAPRYSGAVSGVGGEMLRAGTVSVAFL